MSASSGVGPIGQFPGRRDDGNGCVRAVFGQPPGELSPGVAVQVFAHRAGRAGGAQRYPIGTDVRKIGSDRAQLRCRSGRNGRCDNGFQRLRAAVVAPVSERAGSGRADPGRGDRRCRNLCGRADLLRSDPAGSGREPVGAERGSLARHRSPESGRVLARAARHPCVSVPDTTTKTGHRPLDRRDRRPFQRIRISAARAAAVQCVARRSRRDVARSASFAAHRPCRLLAASLAPGAAVAAAAASAWAFS